MTATGVLEVLTTEPPDLTLWRPGASAQVSSPGPEICVHVHWRARVHRRPAPGWAHLWLQATALPRCLEAAGHGGN